MSKWSDYYIDRVNNDAYESAFMQKYRVFVRCVHDAFKHGAIQYIKEEGCGIGTLSKWIFEDPSVFIFADKDPDMLKFCKHNTRRHPSDPDQSIYIQEDILYDNKFYNGSTLVVTHGVLEHFPQKDVKKIIDGYNSNSFVVGHIHYVPTDKYLKPSFGDERLFRVEEWVELVKPTRYIVDNSGKDLYLITEK